MQEMSIDTDNNLLDAIDARTKLAGSNKMEILLFSLGSNEIFGINVFKVREVTNTPNITKTPNVPRGVEGFISLRGNIIPVISLSSFINLGDPAGCTNQTLIVTEFSRHTQGFLVHEVDRTFVAADRRLWTETGGNFAQHLQSALEGSGVEG